jgi:hypothetical protein
MFTHTHTHTHTRTVTQPLRAGPKGGLPPRAFSPGGLVAVSLAPDSNNKNSGRRSEVLVKQSNHSRDLTLDLASRRELRFISNCGSDTH